VAALRGSLLSSICNAVHLADALACPLTPSGSRPLAGHLELAAGQVEPGCASCCAYWPSLLLAVAGGASLRAGVIQCCQTVAPTPQEQSGSPQASSTTRFSANGKSAGGATSPMACLSHTCLPQAPPMPGRCASTHGGTPPATAPHAPPPSPAHGGCPPARMPTTSCLTWGASRGGRLRGACLTWQVWCRSAALLSAHQVGLGR